MAIRRISSCASIFRPNVSMQRRQTGSCRSSANGSSRLADTASASPGTVQPAARCTSFLPTLQWCGQTSVKSSGASPTSWRSAPEILRQRRTCLPRRDLAGQALIDRFNSQDAVVLRSAVYELEDTAAPPEARSAAKRRLKQFLGQLAGTVRNVGIDLLEKYLESKAGL